MKQWIKENKKILLVSYAVILLCILAAVLVWDRLADSIPIHFNLQGQPDSYGSRFMAVIGMPLILLAAQTVTVLLLYFAKPHQPEILNGIILLIVPAMAVLLQSAWISCGLGKEISIASLIVRFLGLLFIALGNYLPKATRNKAIGIRTRASLSSDDSWNAANRIGGYAFFLTGIALILLSFVLPEKSLMAALLIAGILCAAIPVSFSYSYAKKHSGGSL